MKSKWRILFCDETENVCPVTEFINQCPPKHQVKVLRLLSLLEEQGPILPRPYADILHDGIHELRFSLSRDKVRVLYFFCHQKFIVLYNVFFKPSAYPLYVRLIAAGQLKHVVSPTDIEGKIAS